MVYDYTYNGLGDRLQQTIDGVPTNYTLDINSGLAQVLVDSTNTYLYGQGRIAQVGQSTEYFIGDALGSVRELVDDSAVVTLSQSYEPYGEVLSSVGNGSSIFQYTGEIMDRNGLTYLRARFLENSQGRFLSKDIWVGNVQQPMSYNPWLYVYANPLMYIDPSGYQGDDPRNTPEPPPIGTPAPPSITSNGLEIVEMNECGFGKETGGPEILLKYLLKQFDLEQAWGFSIDLLENLDKHGFPEFSRYIVLPSEIGDINFVKVVFNELSPGDITRMAGRTVGTINVPIGWFLTVMPEQIENVLTQASSQEVRADLLIDTIGFGLSEVVGYSVGIGTTAFVSPSTGGTGVIVGVGVGLFANIVTGATYDYLIDKNDIRQKMTQAYYEWDKFKELPEDKKPKPIPTGPDY